MGSKRKVEAMASTPKKAPVQKKTKPEAPAKPATTSPAKTESPAAPASADAPAYLQIVTGTYEKTLHGFIAQLPPVSAVSKSTDADSSDPSVALNTTFHDTFLFTAHTSPLKTLAISPPAPNSTKRILATTSADERINLYTLSSFLPPKSALSALVPLSGRNRHLGVLHHHVNTPTALVFTPNRTKLISAGADGQINILRCRDWNLLSTIKAPKPKPKPVNYAKDYGEGYGPRIDTFGDEGYGGGRGAINDIALHPSQKIALSVGAGERAVRMWNLMTGRKAGVLVFDKKIIPAHFGREGNRVEWNAAGDEYAVCFDRGIIVFGMDSKPKAQIASKPNSRIHQMRYVTLPAKILTGDPTLEDEEEVIMFSTEDGRILFYSSTPDDEDDITTTPLLGTLGGRSMGMPGRVKDFDILSVGGRWFVVTGGSDGVVRVWDLCGHGSKDIQVAEDATEVKKDETDGPAKEQTNDGDRQVGVLLGMYETGRRITCLGAMVMREGQPEGPEEEEAEAQGDEEEETSDEESD